jgi:hypothetical protein
MKAATQPGTDDGRPGVFVAILGTNRQLDLGRVYSFNIYECPVCSYLEFHDSEPKK